MFLKCFKQLKQPTPEFCLIAYSGFLDCKCFLTYKHKDIVFPKQDVFLKIRDERVENGG